MLTIQNGGASNTTSATNSSSSGVVSNSQRQDFLNLLLAQLTQQTPLEPMDNEKLMSQIIGIETLDRLEGLKQSMDGLTKSSAVDTFGLLNKQVELTVDGNVINGTVESIRLNGSEPQVVIHGVAHPVSEITAVKS